jgi:hypothetical protein
MCDLNGPFKLCTCSTEIDYSKPHWILKTNPVKNEEFLNIIEGMMIPPNLIDKIERRKVLRRLNSFNVFDFEYTPSENDQLELNHQEDDGYKFTFKGDKWVLEEFFGAHPVFEHGTQRDGLIKSLPSKLKEVYSKYLEALEEGEVDIVKCGWSNYRISEKKLIKLLENRVNGEKTELPKGYEPWGF